MKLPVSEEYLETALLDETTANGRVLKRQAIGSLVLNTGRLVACDPFTSPDFPPFNVPAPAGAFTVSLSILHLESDQRVAFATVLFKNTRPKRWDMLTVGTQDLSELRNGELFGYPVDAGTGCFMDELVAQTLRRGMAEDVNYYEVIIRELDKTYQNTWSWTDMRIDGGNLVAFSAGFGDGVYASYAGFDAGNELSAIVTDFCVIPR